jgi:hypothetical protein
MTFWTSSTLIYGRAFKRSCMYSFSRFRRLKNDSLPGGIHITSLLILSEWFKIVRKKYRSSYSFVIEAVSGGMVGA